MTDDEFFAALANQHYSPTMGQVADELGVPEDEFFAKIAELRDQSKLTSIVWDEIGPDDDLAKEDLPTIRAAFGK